MDCFRCGICCYAYQPCLSLKEARQLAAGLGIDLNEFRELYADTRWPGTRTILLRKRDEACIFLERLDGRQTRCRIHKLRPDACRKWQADLNKRECLEGLKQWGLNISPDGRILGPLQAIREFDAFVRSLKDEAGPT